MASLHGVHFRCLNMHAGTNEDTILSFSRRVLFEAREMHKCWVFSSQTLANLNIDIGMVHACLTLVMR